MAAVSETIVREYFELHNFLVRQQRKYIAANRQPDDEDDIDFFVLNPKPQPAVGPLPAILKSQDLPTLHRAIVVVKGWHTETFSQGLLANKPEIFRFAEPKVFQQAARAFGAEGALTKILVVPALPQERHAREQSIAWLQAKGIDAVIPFRTMLTDLVNFTEANRNYQKSDLLQIIRILKNYEFFKEPQLDLFRTRRTRRKTARPEK